MAGPGRPKKIQYEAAEEDRVQENSSESVGGAGESSAAAVIEGVRVIPREIGRMGYTSEPPVMPTSEPVSEIKPIYNWEPISTVPHNGFPVKLTDDVSKPGVICFWRKTRAFANATHRWETTGFWVDSETSQNIKFTPLWWKDRYC